jgi:hypothetical protein
MTMNVNSGNFHLHLNLTPSRQVAKAQGNDLPGIIIDREPSEICEPEAERNFAWFGYFSVNQ